jgi:imidazolonepropionase-like amidohydrolase
VLLLLVTCSLALLGATLAPPSALPPDDAPPTIAFTGGEWFDGTAFVERTLYAVEGRFTDARPASVDTTIALDGHFVVPPFAEAHTHRVDQLGVLDRAERDYLADGVFYVANLNNMPSFANAMRPRLRAPERIDVAFAHGGFTGPGDHPQPLYESLVERGVYDGWSKADLAGEAYHAVTSSEELDAAWTRIQEDRPDLIKAYLMYASTDRAGGLTPDLLGELVTKAHAAGLRVTVHAQSAADVAIAAEQGADQIAHLPPTSFRDSYDASTFRLSAETAALLAERDVSVVTTAMVMNRVDDADAKTAGQAVQAANLRTLHDAGVTLAIGSDRWTSGQPEALYLHELGVFDNATLLRMWTETARVIFPDRALGRLAPDHEASLLALRCNPLDEFACVDDIAVRVKQGRLIELPSAESASTTRR